jgi:hypothetical protein
VEVSGTDNQNRLVVDEAGCVDGTDLRLVVVETADAETEGSGESVNIDSVEVAVDDTEQC